MTGTHPPSLFDLADTDGDGMLSSGDLERALTRRGLELADPRLAAVRDALARHAESGRPIDRATFLESFDSGLGLLRRALENRLIVPELGELRVRLAEMFDRVRDDERGRVASYIPQLAEVDPSLFGMSVCTIDGQRVDLGDSGARFCVQSSHKPFAYCLALEENGPGLVHQHIGHEPSGTAFNALQLNGAGRPHNPMINAGAIMSCAMIRPGDSMGRRFDFIMRRWRDACGGEPVGFSNSVYQSERTTADRNFALGYLMRESGAFPDGVDLHEVLDLYFQCCSIEVSTRSLAVAAATLAHGGICPTTGGRVFSSRTVQSALSLMLSCGMYDFSGEFAFSVGIPAKSGVSGVIVGVVPNLFGFAVYSPRLDEIGNSVRGVEMCRALVDRYALHLFDSLATGDKDDLRANRVEERAERVLPAIWASSVGDLDGLQQLVSRGVDVRAADYDHRTPLHLAAAEGHLRVVRYLLARGADRCATDRWGATPIDDARRGGHDAVVACLETEVGDRSEEQSACAA